jgi:asparagine synthase (glutamine-hydrolysing)
MADSGLFDLQAVGRLVDQHGSGDFDHAQALWNLLVVEGFLLAEATRSDEGSMAGRRVA